MGIFTGIEYIKRKLITSSDGGAAAGDVVVGVG